MDILMIEHEICVPAPYKKFQVHENVIRFVKLFLQGPMSDQIWNRTDESDFLRLWLLF